MLFVVVRYPNGYPPRQQWLKLDYMHLILRVNLSESCAISGGTTIVGYLSTCLETILRHHRKDFLGLIKLDSPLDALKS